MTKWTAEVIHTFICALLLMPKQLRPPRMSLGQVCGKRTEEWQSIVNTSVLLCCKYPKQTGNSYKLFIELLSEWKWSCFGTTHKHNEYLYPCPENQSLKHTPLWVCRTHLAAWFSSTLLFLDIIFLLRKKGSPDRQGVHKKQILTSFNSHATKIAPAAEVDNTFILKIDSPRTPFRAHQQPVWPQVRRIDIYCVHLDALMNSKWTIIQLIGWSSR